MSKGFKKGHVPWNKGRRTNRVLNTIRLIESGELFKQCEPSIRKHIKRYLIYKNGNCCSICKTTKWCGRDVPLVCDHINGISNDNRIENYRLVCCNCDAQLPTYKSKNRGKGRTYYKLYKRKVNGRLLESG